MDVLLARIEAGEGGVGERRTDVQSGLAGPGARLRDGEGLADLGRQRRGRRWHHHGRGGRHWRGGRGGHGRGRGGGRGGHGRGRDGGRRGGGPARGRGARARARPRRGRGSGGDEPCDEIDGRRHGFLDLFADTGGVVRHVEWTTGVVPPVARGVERAGGIGPRTNEEPAPEHPTRAREV